MCSSISRNAPLRSVLAAVAVVILSVLPAHACPVCVGSSSQKVLLTYFVTAAAMTLAALGSVVGITAWLYWRFKQSGALLGEGER